MELHGGSDVRAQGRVWGDVEGGEEPFAGREVGAVEHAGQNGGVEPAQVLGDEFVLAGEVLVGRALGYDTVKREKGSLDVLWASAGGGEPAPLGEITEAQFDTWFGLNARGTLFTVQKALPLFNDGGSILMTGSNASLGAFPGWSVYAGSKAVQQAWARIWLNELKDRRISVNVLTPGQVATAKQAELFDEAEIVTGRVGHRRNRRAACGCPHRLAGRPPLRSAPCPARTGAPPLGRSRCCWP
ncbi:SDR family NAD(P)-dependent oxidoreductase [Streptomyces sp. NBC_01538]|uniref:SDR family NAD(P)-dependent oxidoreductase n=1 Tax=Streptomyces sp. NBC_01538 TaxID=2903897 RepID=UPI003870764A